MPYCLRGSIPLVQIPFQPPRLILFSTQRKNNRDGEASEVVIWPCDNSTTKVSDIMATCLEKKTLKSVFPYGFQRQSIHWLCYQAKYVDTRTKKIELLEKTKEQNTAHCLGCKYTYIRSSEITPNLFMLRMHKGNLP